MIKRLLRLLKYFDNIVKKETINLNIIKVFLSLQ